MKKQSKEFLDIIDKREKVIGKAERSEFHDAKKKRKLLHRAVHVVVVDKKSGLVWIQKRGNTDLYPNFWELGATGHVDSREEPYRAALREVREELGLQPKKLVLLKKYVVKDKYQRQLNYLYWFETSEKPTKGKDLKELKLIAPDQIEKLVSTGKTTPATKIDWKIIKSTFLIKN